MSKNKTRNQPLVTIAIPTFNRPNLLLKALKSVLKQDYYNLEIIISDNNSLGDETENILKPFLSRKDIIFYKQNINIGALSNFDFCLQKASGKYFMWLADDDELFGSEMIQSLVKNLEINKEIVVASPRWNLKENESHSIIMPLRDYMNKNVLKRAIKYTWKSDDSFFYGLHRTKNLRNINFPVFLSWKQTIPTYWCYSYLYQIILSGKILCLPSNANQWINNNYTKKFDPRNFNVPEKNARFINFLKFKNSFLGFLFISARRLNVYALNVIFSFKKKGLFFGITIFLVSIIAYLRDIILLILNSNTLASIFKYILK